jgi:hypothetical protein
MRIERTWSRSLYRDHGRKLARRRAKAIRLAEHIAALERDEVSADFRGLCDRLKRDLGAV